MRKAAKLQTGMYEAMSERTVEAIKMQVIQQYLLLEFAYQYEAVTKEGLKTIQAIYKLTNDRFAQGMMQKSDLLNVEVQVKAAEVQNNQAKSQIEMVSDQLSGLMHSDKGVVYTIMPYELDTINETSDAVSMQRADIKAMSTALDSYEMMIKGTKLGLAPKLNGFANYNINDNTLGVNGDKSYIAGLQLSWDIFKGNQVKHKSAAQKFEKIKMQEQLNSQLEQGSIEIRKTKRTIQDADYKIKQQVKSVEQADESLRILKNRYEQGLVSTNDVLIAQTQLSEQKLKLAQARLEQKAAINYLSFLAAK
jgi:outer membrane protein TolC